MKFVGQAATDNIYDKNRICLFGIPNWMTVTHNDTLQRDQVNFTSNQAYIKSIKRPYFN